MSSADGASSRASSAYTADAAVASPPFSAATKAARVSAIAASTTCSSTPASVSRERCNSVATSGSALQRELERVVERGGGALLGRCGERGLAAEAPRARLGRLVQLALERLEVGAHLLEQRARGAEQEPRALTAAACCRHPGHPLEAPGEVLLVARLAPVRDAVAEAVGRVVEPAELQRDRAEVEQCPRDVGRVAARAQEREALLEERLGASVVADREREVAEVVDRECGDSLVADVARERDGLLEEDGCPLVVAGREDDRAEVAESVRDVEVLAGLARDGQALLRERRSRPRSRPAAARATRPR